MRMRDPFAEHLGIEVLEAGPGHARLRGTLGPEHANQHGGAHGGYLYTIADVAFSLAANAHGPRAVGLVTAMHFTRGVEVGETVEARAREVKLGRRAATYEVTVTSDDGTVALFTGTVHREDA